MIQSEHIGVKKNLQPVVLHDVALDDRLAPTRAVEEVLELRKNFFHPPDAAFHKKIGEFFFSHD